jgi:TFIIH basal transcription factor complex TTD-A subunit
MLEFEIASTNIENTNERSRHKGSERLVATAVCHSGLDKNAQETTHSKQKTIEKETIENMPKKPTIKGGSAAPSAGAAAASGVSSSSAKKLGEAAEAAARSAGSSGAANGGGGGGGNSSNTDNNDSTIPPPAGYLISCDVPLKQFIQYLNELKPVDKRFILQDLDATHLLINSKYKEEILKKVEEWEDSNIFSAVERVGEDFDLA